MNTTYIIYPTKLLRIFTSNLCIIYLVRYTIYMIFIYLNLDNFTYLINPISSIIFFLLKYIYLIYANKYSTNKNKKCVLSFRKYFFKNIVLFYTLSFIIHTYIIPKSLLWLIFIFSFLPLFTELQVIVTISGIINCIASTTFFIAIFNYILNILSQWKNIFDSFIFTLLRINYFSCLLSAKKIIKEWLITHFYEFWGLRVKFGILPDDFSIMKDTVRKMGSKISELNKTERELDWTTKMSGLDFKETINGNIVDDTKKKAVESIIKINSKWHEMKNDLNRDMAKVEDYKTLNPEFILSTESSAFRSSCTKVRIRFDLSQSNFLRKYPS